MSKTKTKSFFFSSIIIAGILFSGCKTTRTVTQRAFDPEAPAGSSVIVSDDLEFSETGSGEKYIFFRLYNPIYRNPLYIANILKGGIGSTRIGNVPEVSHASINFDLEDDFYGLSLGEEHELKIEECLNPEGNAYMIHCNPDKSEQVTYALKVSQEEFDNAKEFVERYAASTDIKYASMYNFNIAFFSIKRKFFTSKERKKFGNLKYPKSKKTNLVDPTGEKVENNFVCSTFVAYTLYNNVESVREYFDEHKIKYDYVNVADVSEIPGVEPLFYSKWTNYLEAAHAFVEEYPEFEEYLPE